MISLQNRVTVNSVVNPNLSAPSFSNLYSVLLDGVDEYVNIDAVQTALASTTVGTISFWVKTIDATPTSTEVLFSFNDTNGNEYIYCPILTTGALRIELRQSGTRQFRVQTDNAVFSDGVWSHVAITQDGILPKIYINSVLVAQQTLVANDVTQWFNDLSGLDNGRIGAYDFNSTGAKDFFNGNTDEVLFINRALTQPQIADIYNSGSPKDETAIANGVSQFRFDGDTVPTATDAIGSNNGTFVNIEQADIELDVP